MPTIPPLQNLLRPDAARLTEIAQSRRMRAAPTRVVADEALTEEPGLIAALVLTDDYDVLNLAGDAPSEAEVLQRMAAIILRRLQEHRAMPLE